MRVILKGGLGNQLFQFFTAVKEAQQLHDEITLDTSYLRGNIGHDVFLLDKIVNFGPRVKVDNTNFKIQRIKNQLYFLANAVSKNVLIRSGYFQNLQQLPSNIFESNLYYSFKTPKVSSARQCAVHIRLGDYLTPRNASLYITDRSQYLQQAVMHLKERFGITKFHIVTDTPSKCLEYLPDNEIYEIFHSNDAIECFNFIRLSSSKIICNSTFSWWAAFLSNPDDNIICPKHWFHDQELQKNSEAMLPNNWTYY